MVFPVPDRKFNHLIPLITSYIRAGSEPTPAVDLLDGRDQGLAVQVEVADRPHPRGFLRVDDRPASLRVHDVADHRLSADALALSPHRRHLSRVRSEMSSRSNRAKESRIFRVSHLPRARTIAVHR